MNALDEFRAASEANDLDRFVATLSPDAELVSPLLARAVIRGRDDLRLLFAAVYGSLSVWFALVVGAKVMRHPGLLRRAASRA